ncbi:MAG: hypothetical protein A2V65_05425 [Deltaproteobacteria bacterium RBG_13_49_15]|nr:MAG: hypothetical protein A2V65_05425 [Deltaproteobacteria bacterium RBG_13_49_15]
MMSERISFNIFLKTRVARRFFYLFMMCALLPLLAIASISYLYVGRQLKDQAFKRLHQQVKSKGFEVYDRLMFLENELEAVAQKITQNQWKQADLIHYHPLKHEGNRFRSIETIPVDRQSLLPADRPDFLINFTNDRWAHLVGGGSLIGILDGEGLVPKILMMRLVEKSEPAKGILAGEVDPLYLWGIGMDGALPPGVEMAIFTPEKRVLISSFADLPFIRTSVETLAQGSFSGNYETIHDKEVYFNSYWPLFLRHHFSSPDWIFVFSQSKASILAPVSNFSRIFGLLILLTFWIIVLVTLITLRKRMVPVETLKAGAMKIAQGEFEHRVDIKSGDEFELLAETFNEMSLKLKQGQAMLVQAAKMSAFGQMAAGIVHEIGQPLTAINGYAELLAMGADPEDQKHYLEIIQSEGNRLAQIISKFRSFSKSSKEASESIDVDDVLNKTTMLLEHQLMRSSVQLKMEMAGDLPIIAGDRNELQQVFLNILINAIDALENRPPDHRQVYIKTDRSPDSVRVQIEDNGCGIPPEIQARIFDPFFTTKTEEKGTGLGLAVINSILHKHHARIDVWSEVDRGTRFTVSFPVPKSN